MQDRKIKSAKCVHYKHLTYYHCCMNENQGTEMHKRLEKGSANTDLALKMCVSYAEPRISRVMISSGRARTISRNPVHTLKAKSVLLMDLRIGSKLVKNRMEASLYKHCQYALLNFCSSKQRN